MVFGPLVPLLHPLQLECLHKEHREITAENGGRGSGAEDCESAEDDFHGLKILRDIYLWRKRTGQDYGGSVNGDGDRGLV